MNTSIKTSSAIKLFGAVLFSAAIAGMMTFGGDSNSASAAVENEAVVATAPVSAGKGDKLCADETWPPQSEGCISRIMTDNGRETRVRVVGAGISEAQRAPVQNVQSADVTR